MREADLYAPVKAYLEAQGYEVKAEIGDCDLLARRGDDPPVIVELKLTFSLALVMQGVARQALFEDVYLAVPVSSDRGWKLRYKDIIRLCRRLGLGLLAVRVEATASVEAHLDPGPYQPRKTNAGLAVCCGNLSAGRVIRTPAALQASSVLPPTGKTRFVVRFTCRSMARQKQQSSPPQQAPIPQRALCERPLWLVRAD